MTMRHLLISALVCLAGTALLAMNVEQRSVDNAAESARRPAPTLTRPTTSTQAPDEEGFIRRWLILEPIGATGLTDSAVQAAVRKEYFSGQFTVIPHDLDTVKVGGLDLTWHALDSKLYNINLYHFAYALHKPTSNVLFWAVTVVDCLYELKDVRLAIGSNAASVWWVNGKEVIGIYGDRQAVIDDGVSRRITLKKGLNVVRGVVINGGGATDFCARFLDRKDAPVKSFVVNLGKVQTRAGKQSSYIQGTK